MSVNSNPKALWENLLQPEILAKLKCVFGVSVPFIVGAYHRRGFISREDMCCSNCIRIVLSDIRSKDDNHILIEDCTKVYNSEINGIEKVAIIKDGGPGISDTVIYNLKEYAFDEIVNLLWKKYQDKILISNFSYDNETREWRAFTPQEERVIDTLEIG